MSWHPIGMEDAPPCYSEDDQLPEWTCPDCGTLAHGKEWEKALACPNRRHDSLRLWARLLPESYTGLLT